MILYGISNGVFTGVVEEIGDDEGFNGQAWTTEAPPVHRIDQQAVLGANGWVVMDRPDPLPAAVDPLAAQKAALIGQIGAKAEEIFDTGYTVPSGTLAGQVLQTRPQDQNNWNSSGIAYTAACANGMGDHPGALFRTFSNENFFLTFTEGLMVLLSMETWGSQVDAHEWSLKDAVRKAATQDDLDAIQVNAGWPT